VAAASSQFGQLADHVIDEVCQREGGGGGG
jgi:hypothetical protein